jgi:hypothetical protein
LSRAIVIPITPSERLQSLLWKTRRTPAVRDTQHKMLERIETIVTAYNTAATSLELVVNYSRENCGQIFVQPTGCFLNIIECGFTFESRFAVFDFGETEMQIEYAKPETVLRVLERFRSAVGLYIREHGKKPVLVSA